MVDLLSCPFCGKDAQIAPDEIGSGGQHVPPYHAGCFRGAGCGIAFTADDPDEAIAEWNRRPLSTITPAEAGGLVDAQSEARAIALAYETAVSQGDAGYPTAAFRAGYRAALAAKDAKLTARKQAAEHLLERALAAEAALAEANKALEPFADDAEKWAEYSDIEVLVEGWNGGPESTLTVGHLRAARRVREGGKADG